MKKALRLFLIIILAFSALKANAVILSGDSVKSYIEKQVLKRYKKYTDAELDVKVVGLPFKDLEIPEGKIEYEITSGSDKFMPRELEKVSIYVDGICIRTFNAPIVVKAYQKVLTAEGSIPRERMVTPDLVKIEKKEVSNTLNYVLTKESLKKELIAKKYFRPGEVIDRRYVKLKPDILRNSNVTVFFESNNLTVSVNARALSDGVIGDEICTINKIYNRIYKGTVIDKNKVLVRI